MKLKNIALSFLAFLLINPSQSFSAPKSSILILAKVNNQIITNVDLTDRYNFFLSVSKITANSKTEKFLILNQLLQKMIDEELQLNDATNLKLDIETDELNNALETMADEQNKTASEFKKFLISHHISYENYVKQTRSQILWSKIINKVISPKIKISESEIKETLELKKIKNDEVKFSLSEIYIPINHEFGNKDQYSADLANKLLKEVRSGKDFKNLVKQFSGSVEAGFNGEIGWIGKNDLDIAVYKAIEKLKIGGISDPIFMKDGYYIFKVLDKKTISTLKDEDINEVKNYIFNKKLQLEAKGYLMDLRKNSFIEINQDSINTVN